jgi:hypothetical protein
VIADRLPSAAVSRRAPSAAPPRWRAGPRSHFASLVVYALLLAGALGLSSAFWATKGDYPLGRVNVGAWTAWPRAGSRDADPYTRAIIARTGDIPLAIGEGLILRATADDAGRALDPRCVYRIGTTTPQARYWTLTLYDDAGRPITGEGRSSFSSGELLRDAAGGFVITLGREARSGNWMMMPERGRVSLVLRLYDTPASSGSAALDRASMPAIERLECAP